MKRHNKSQASMPNPQIDLTSLLDVIFIFLFVVMIYAVQLTDKIQTEAVSANGEYQKKISNLNNTVSGLSKQITDLEDENGKLLYVISANNGYSETLKDVNERVSVVYIHCQARAGTNGVRDLTIETTEGELLTFEFNKDNENTAYGRIERSLEEYIQNNSSGENKKIIFLSINTEDILVRDMNKLTEIINRFINDYENVN